METTVKNGNELRIIKRKTVFIVISLLCLSFFLACDKSDGDDKAEKNKNKRIVTNFVFTNGIEFPGEDKPDPTESANTPVVSGLNFSQVVRQDGMLTGTVYFTDADDYTGVTTLILKIDQDDSCWEFPVVPIFNPLTSEIFILFSLPMAKNFTPGIFTFYIGLKDTDGNVSNYLHRVLIVKSLKDLSITSLTPLDGDSDVPLNSYLRATFSQQVFENEVEIVLSDGVTNVTGTTFMSNKGKAITFLPDTFLTPDTLYRAKVSLTVNGRSMTHSFTSQNPAPVGDPAGVVGNIFTFEITEDDLIEPGEGKSLLSQLPITVLPPMLIKPLDINGGSIQYVAGAGEPDGGGGYVQVPHITTFGPDTGQFTNPYFSIGPMPFHIDLSSLGFPGQVGMHDITISGRFVENGGVIDSLEDVSFYSYIDTNEINEVIDIVAGGAIGDVNLCDIIPICDSEGLIKVLAVNMVGQLEGGVTNLYDMFCSANPDSLDAAAGGDISITCSLLEDGMGYLGTDISLFAQTGLSGPTPVGVWDTSGYTCAGDPPTCQVPDAGGQVSVTVSVASGEVASDERFFLAGGVNNSPIGLMMRVLFIDVY